MLLVIWIPSCEGMTMFALIVVPAKAGTQKCLVVTGFPPARE